MVLGVSQKAAAPEAGTGSGQALLGQQTEAESVSRAPRPLPLPVPSKWGQKHL